MKQNTSYTQQDVDNRTSDYICFDCGKQFVNPNREALIVTAHTSTCGLCKEEKVVTHMRAWNWLIIKNN